MAAFTSGYMEEDPTGVRYWYITKPSNVCGDVTLSTGSLPADATAAEVIDDLEAFGEQLPRKFNSLFKVKEAGSKCIAALLLRTSSSDEGRE